MASCQPKVILIGDSLAGKTTILLQLLRNNFAQTDPTVGASYALKEVSVGDRKVVFRVWDTAGQEQFRSLIPMYLRGSTTAILVIDVSSATALDTKDEWCRLAEENNDNDISIFVVANKMDLEPSIDLTALREWAQQRSYYYAQITARSHADVAALFQAVAKDLVERDRAPVFHLSETPSERPRSSCC